MRPCNSSVVGDPRSLINDFHSIIFAPSGALPHKGRARIVHRVAQSDPQTANSASVTLSHRAQPCYGPGGGLWRHQPPGRRGLYPNASLGAPHSRPNQSRRHREPARALPSRQARVPQPTPANLIRDADTVVFVLSPTSARSEICAWEVGEAARLGKRILPILCRPLDGASPPPRLRDLNYSFFYEDPKVLDSGFGTGLAKLVVAQRAPPVLMPFAVLPLVLPLKGAKKANATRHWP
jgi:TIR domain